jgi:ribose transport system ATP-binding protein
MSLSTPPRLRINSASKTFGGQTVLSDFALDIEAGEVHALVGHNGSGKSTFVKLLAGYHQPDPGARATVDGEAFELGSASAAAAAGMRFVHQDLGLAETLSAVDNLFLGASYPTRPGGRIDWKAAWQETAEAIGSLGFDFDPSTPVQALSPTQRTGLAIARATRAQATPGRVLVLDEPTAALPAREVSALFAAIDTLRRQGLAILYISHHLEEVFAVAQRVTVLRDGRHVTTCPVDEVDEARLIELMIGEPVERARSTARAIAGDVPAVLEARGLGAATLAGVDLSVRRGEVLGVAGVDGSGREALAPALFGAIDRAGEVSVAGESLPRLRPDVAVRRGVGYVPADRAGDGALARMTVSENLTVSRMPTRLRGLLFNAGDERREALDWGERLGLRPRRPEASIETLSGGNQQKVMLARWLRTDPRLLILDEPTKGVDVGAVKAIWSLVAQAAAGGTAVVACSSDTEELAANCDRVLVLSRGHLASVVAGEELTAERLDTLALQDATGEPA